MHCDFDFAWSITFVVPTTTKWVQLVIQQEHIRTSVVREGEIECFHKAT